MPNATNFPCMFCHSVFVTREDRWCHQAVSHPSRVEVLSCCKTCSFKTVSKGHVSEHQRLCAAFREERKCQHCREYVPEGTCHQCAVGTVPTEKKCSQCGKQIKEGTTHQCSKMQDSQAKCKQCGEQTTKGIFHLCPRAKRVELTCQQCGKQTLEGSDHRCYKAGLSSQDVALNSQERHAENKCKQCGEPVTSEMGHVCQKAASSIRDMTQNSTEAPTPQNHGTADFENEYECGVCEEVFLAEEMMFTHLAKVHSDMVEVLTCVKSCDFVTVESDHLRQHASRCPKYIEFQAEMQRIQAQFKC